MNFLIFRTDRVGDFLLSLFLIKNIKKAYPNSIITIVASVKNHNYIKTFDEVDNVIILNNNFFSKLKTIFYLRKKKYDTIIIHDGKNRSKFISFFLKYKRRLICITDLIKTQSEIIKNICTQLKIDFNNSSLNFLDNRKHSNTIPFDKYVHIHFDEKWIFEDYIRKYTNIEPNESEFLEFLNKIIKKNKKIIITTGKRSSKLLGFLKGKINDNDIKIFENQNLLEIESIVFNSELLITCHGWISHIASAKKIRQIDIIDKTYPYNTWTSHFRNYTSLDRKPFSLLSQEIIDKI